MNVLIQWTLWWKRKKKHLKRPLWSCGCVSSAVVYLITPEQWGQLSLYSSECNVFTTWRFSQKAAVSKIFFPPFVTFYLLSFMLLSTRTRCYCMSDNKHCLSGENDPFFSLISHNWLKPFNIQSIRGLLSVQACWVSSTNYKQT